MRGGLSRLGPPFAMLGPTPALSLDAGRDIAQGLRNDKMLRRLPPGLGGRLRLGYGKAGFFIALLQKLPLSL